MGRSTGPLFLCCSGNQHVSGEESFSASSGAPLSNCQNKKRYTVESSCFSKKLFEQFLFILSEEKSSGAPYPNASVSLRLKHSRESFFFLWICFKSKKKKKVAVCVEYFLWNWSHSWNSGAKTRLWQLLLYKVDNTVRTLNKTFSPFLVRKYKYA